MAADLTGVSIDVLHGFASEVDNALDWRGVPPWEGPTEREMWTAIQKGQTADECAVAWMETYYE